MPCYIFNCTKEGAIHCDADSQEEAEAMLQQDMGSFYVNDFHSGREECGDGWVLGECYDVLKEDLN